MSSRLGMTHLCVVQRDAALADEFGAETTPDWQDHLTALPCRAWTNTGRDVVDAESTAVVVDRRVSVALDTDVTERDRLGDVTDRAGAVIFDGPSRIVAVLRFDDHLELALERVR